MASPFHRLQQVARGWPPRRRGTVLVLMAGLTFGFLKLLDLLPFRSFMEPALVIVLWMGLSVGIGQIVHDRGFDENPPSPLAWFYVAAGLVLAAVHCAYRYRPEIGLLFAS